MYPVHQHLNMELQAAAAALELAVAARTTRHAPVILSHWTFKAIVGTVGALTTSKVLAPGVMLTA